MSNGRVEKLVQVPIPDIAIQSSGDAGRRYWLEHIQCWKLFLERNKQYGNSIEETGVLGAVVELVAKNARLRELVLKNPRWGEWPVNGAVHDEEEDVAAVRDTLRDLVNYGIIALMMMSEDNWKGVEVE